MKLSHNVSNNDRFNIEFKGGTNNFRYYTNVQLLTNKGFIKNFQEQLVILHRINIPAEPCALTWTSTSGPKTKLHTHLYGLLTEQSQPGSSRLNLWSMIYKVPANAFPVKVSETVWAVILYILRITLWLRARVLPITRTTSVLFMLIS